MPPRLRRTRTPRARLRIHLQLGAPKADELTAGEAIPIKDFTWEKSFDGDATLNVEGYTEEASSFGVASIDPHGDREGIGISFRATRIGGLKKLGNWTSIASRHEGSLVTNSPLTLRRLPPTPPVLGRTRPRGPPDPDPAPPRLAHESV